MTIDEPVADILARLQGLSAEEILADAAARYPGRVALASSLSVEDQALTHMIAAGGLGIPIFTLDTGRLHPETHELIDRTNKRYGFRMRVYCPDAAEVEKMVADNGIDLFRDSEFLRQLCCETRKTQAAAARAGRAGRLDLRPARRPGRRVPEGRAGGVGQRRRPPEAQPARRVGRGARVGLRPRARRPLQPAARPGLPDRRLRAVHGRRDRRHPQNPTT